jgi:hypothetical protein
MFGLLERGSILRRLTGRCRIYLAIRKRQVLPSLWQGQNIQALRKMQGIQTLRKM